MEVKEEKVTLMLETAAARYDVVLSTLQRLCARKMVKSTTVGKRRYVEVAEMDRLFRGAGILPVRAIRASRKTTK